MQAKQSLSEQNARSERLNKRLEDIGWGVFLIMVGALWLLPGAQLPQGIWLIGAAVIMLGLNAARYFAGIKMSGFTIALGVLALAAGLGSFMGVKVPIFAALLILIGASIMFKPLFEKRR